MKNLWVVIFYFYVASALAQVPSNYYSPAEGLTGYELKSTLHSIIDDHSVYPYSSSSSFDVWDFVNESDLKTDNTIWDIYSDVPGGNPAYSFTPVSDQCGNYSGEGDCYNREHSFPKSWFSDQSPMNTDFHHLYATDGYVNSRRGNLPYGIVASASWTSTNGSKVGSSGINGYSGTVFEPIDEYKGDLARTYFYMATRYQDVINSWESDMLDGSQDKVFTDWALDLLLDWHEADPVSQKEIDRNQAIYNYQGNSNPYIDHPEYVACVWNNTCEQSSTPELTISSSSIADFGGVYTSQSSESKSYTLSGVNIIDNIIIEISPNFELSLNNVDFNSEINLTNGADITEGTLDQTTIFVRFVPSMGSQGVINGQITHESEGAETKIITVVGTELVDQDDQDVAITITNLEHTYDGTEKSVSVSTNPSNINYTIQYNSNEQAPINAGEYNVIVNISQDGYIGSASDIMKINPAEAQVIVTNLEHEYDGAPRSVVVNTVPENIEFTVLYGSSLAPPREPGSYVVQTTVTDNNYFGSSLDVLTIKAITSVGDERNDEFVIYPNPANQKVIISNANIGSINFILSDIKGNTLKSGIVNPTNDSVDLTGYHEGVYILKIITPIASYTQKLVVKR